MNKTSYMQNTNYVISPYFAILLVFLIFFVSQITIKAKANFDIEKNRGELQLRLFFVTIFWREISFGKYYLKITNKKGKSKYLPIEANKQSIQQYTEFQEILFKKIYAQQILLFLNFCIENSPLLTSMICGYFDVISKALFCILKTKKSELVFKSKIYPSFEKTLIKFQIKAKISLSIYDLLWSYTEAKLQDNTQKLQLKGDYENGKQPKN